MTAFAHWWVVLAASPDAREAVRRLFASVRGRGLDAAGDPDPADPEYLNGGTELAAASDPSGDVAGWVWSFCGTEAERAVLEGVESGGGFPAGLYYCRCDNAGGDPGRLRATNHPLWADAVAAGAVLHFDLDWTLQKLGLAFRRPSDLIQ